MSKKIIFFPKKIWRKHISRWSITDCAVREKTVVYLCMRKNISPKKASSMWDHDIPTRSIVFSLADPSGRTWGGCNYTGYNRPVIGVARKPLPQGLLVDRGSDGHVSMMGGGRQFPDEFIAPGNDPFTQRVKCINDYAYSVGRERLIYKRTDIGKWELFAELTEKHYPGYRMISCACTDSGTM